MEDEIEDKLNILLKKCNKKRQIKNGYGTALDNIVNLYLFNDIFLCFGSFKNTLYLTDS
jgi:hypothetical protein